MEKVWHENDEFWETWSSFMFTENTIKSASEDVESIISLLNLDKNLKILDLCCGIGRHTYEFAKRGYTVTGVDRTSKYLQQAKDRLSNDDLVAEFIQEDMRKYKSSNTFDVVINLFTSFSYFKEIEDDKQVLRNICESLKPGGISVIELMGKEILARIFQSRDWEEIDGVYALQQRETSQDWSWMKNKWIIIKEGVIKEYFVEHRLYSAFELKIMLKEVGFSEIKVYGDFKGSPYNENARRLICIAKK